ncbi:hypothetical protein [Streptomyces sp. NPDC002133]|uniref:8-oxoguanine DNA glycosylase OGG fold protein n=1 Tax=Streptomyces sp. NPDC002133 TaxID=3154409 RepID=UPI00332D0F8C
MLLFTTLLEGAGMRRQDLADALDAEMLDPPLPPDAIGALSGWLSGPGAAYSTGPGSHAVAYVPSRWVAIRPWPDRLAPQSSSAPVALSRSEVVATVREAVADSQWDKALIAAYVWGTGGTGYGPHRLKEILAMSGSAEPLSQTEDVLRGRDPVAAYAVLDKSVRGLGPAFFTKLLYFVDLALNPPPGPRALILDQRVARVLRAHANLRGSARGVPSAASTARWIWSDTGWTAHRYAVYLRWITAASKQLIASDAAWPVSTPDLLELALFDGAWRPSTGALTS